MQKYYDNVTTLSGRKHRARENECDQPNTGSGIMNEKPQYAGPNRISFMQHVTLLTCDMLPFVIYTPAGRLHIHLVLRGTTCLEKTTLMGHGRYVS